MFDADMRHLSAVNQVVLREDLDPQEGSCSSCPHAPFIHSDLGARPCLYSACECPGYVNGREQHPDVRDEDETETEPAPVVAVIGPTYLVITGRARPNGRS